MKSAKIFNLKNFRLYGMLELNTGKSNNGYTVHTLHVYYTRSTLYQGLSNIIIESVDSISRGRPDTPICAMQNKKLKNSAQMKF